MHRGTSDHFALDTDILRLLGRDSKRPLETYRLLEGVNIIEYVPMTLFQRNESYTYIGISFLKQFSNSLAGQT